jgi:hypothetical protein
MEGIPCLVVISTRRHYLYSDDLFFCISSATGPTHRPAQQRSYIRLLETATWLARCLLARSSEIETFDLVTPKLFLLLTM